MSDATQAKNSVARQEKDLKPYEQLVAGVNGKAELEKAFSQEDAFELAKESVNRIASATTADELFDASEQSAAGLPSMGRDWTHLSDPINIVEVRFRKSDEKYAAGGLGAMAVVDYALDNGEVFTIGVGAPNVVAFFGKWDSMPADQKAAASRIRVRPKATGRGEMLYVTRA
jgi:hypothetical protein